MPLGNFMLHRTVRSHLNSIKFKWVLKFMFEWQHIQRWFYESWFIPDMRFNACLGISSEVYQANIGSSIRAVDMGNTLQITRNKAKSKSALKIHINATWSTKMVTWYESYDHNELFKKWKIRLQKSSLCCNTSKPMAFIRTIS